MNQQSTEPENLIINGNFEQPLENGWKPLNLDDSAASYPETGLQSFKKALCITCGSRKDMPWDVSIYQDFEQPFEQGDWVHVRLWARSRDLCRIGIIHQTTSPLVYHLGTAEVWQLTPEWKEYIFQGKMIASVEPGQSRLIIWLNYDFGDIEMTGVRVYNYGKIKPNVNVNLSYLSDVFDEAWREPAEARIEKIRKGDLTIKITRNNKPVPAAEVKIAMKRHHFRFGTAGPASRLIGQDDDSIKYQAVVNQYFNVFTFENDLKWENEEPRFEIIDKAIQFLQKHKIDVRGHCLIWGGYEFLNKKARELTDTSALIKACKDHIEDYASRYKDVVYLWDVVNETQIQRWLWDKIGWEYFPQTYHWTREADTNVELCYNDNGLGMSMHMGDRYPQKLLNKCRYLVNSGAPVNVLGEQAHLSTPLTPIPSVLSDFDKLAEFGLPIEITEYDLGCMDEDLQAKYFDAYLTAVFSHPAIKTFIMWGFWENSHWRAKDGAAMFRADWSRKPSVDVYEKLVLNKWQTNTAETTDTDGIVKFRAFYGTYTASVEADGATKTIELELAPNSKNELVIEL